MYEHWAECISKTWFDQLSYHQTKAKHWLTEMNWVDDHMLSLLLNELSGRKAVTVVCIEELYSLIVCKLKNYINKIITINLFVWALTYCCCLYLFNTFCVNVLTTVLYLKGYQSWWLYQFLSHLSVFCRRYVIGESSRHQQSRTGKPARNELEFSLHISTNLIVELHCSIAWETINQHSQQCWNTFWERIIWFENWLQFTVKLASQTLQAAASYTYIYVVSIGL